MRRLAVLTFLLLAAVPAFSSAQLSVRELKALIVAARTKGQSDAEMAAEVARVGMTERLTEAALDDLRAPGLGPKTASVLELLEDDSEFLNSSGGETSSVRPLTRSQAAEVLAKAREAAGYNHNLPQFICDKVIRRFDNQPTLRTDAWLRLGELHLEDVVTSEAVLNGGRELSVAGTAAGLSTWGEIGSVIESVLGGGADARTEWDRWEVIDGARVAVFRYSVDRDHSHYSVGWCCDGNYREQITPGYSGELFVAPSSGGVVRVTRQAVLPPGFPARRLDTMIEYHPVGIGGQAYMLPLKSVTIALWKSRGAGFVYSLNEARFSSYRKPAAGSVLAVAGPPSPVPGSILRVTSRLVDVSAVVLDKHGDPVTDLKKGDFEIYDEGKRQDIRLFSAPVKGVQEVPWPANTPSRGVFSNRIEDRSRGGGVTIFLIDLGFATTEQWLFARGRIIQFLQQARTEDRIGLYEPVRDGVGIVHELTGEFSYLVGILEDWNFNAPVRSRVAVAGWKTNLHCPSRRALEAITASADHLAGIAGRKNLIWISGGGRMSISGPGKPDQPQNCFVEESQTLQAANRANVSLYSIDFRGLQAVQPDATIGPKDVTGPLALNGLVQGKLNGIERDHAMLRDVADRTGGLAFSDNDILGALRTAFADSHAAYSLGFSPESPRFDGQYRQLQVKATGRPDVTVRFRSGYVDARESPDPEAQLRDAVKNPLDADAIAMTAQMTEADDGGGYDVKLNIGIGDLDLQPDDSGQWQGRIHVFLAERDEVGQPLDHWDDTLQLELKADRYEAMRKSGLAYHRTFQQNPGARSLRVVVMDEEGKLGSVTIPLTPPEKQLRRR
jgi:VWFA-related protein